MFFCFLLRANKTEKLAARDQVLKTKEKQSEKANFKSNFLILMFSFHRYRIIKWGEAMVSKSLTWQKALIIFWHGIRLSF